MPKKNMTKKELDVVKKDQDIVVKKSVKKKRQELIQMIDDDSSISLDIGFTTLTFNLPKLDLPIATRCILDLDSIKVCLDIK